MSIDFTESYTEENHESHQKIIHTLSAVDDELPDDNSCIGEHLIDDTIQDVKSSFEYEQKPIARSTTNSKSIQEQINRAQKRKERLQKFNYRFRNNSGAELAENEPAYKRQGVELNDIQHSSQETVSNLNLSQNQDGGLELKSKNSFLHDNVD